jgi:hypothetical protein
MPTPDLENLLRRCRLKETLYFSSGREAAKRGTMGWLETKDDPTHLAYFWRDGRDYILWTFEGREDAEDYLEILE